MLLASVLLAAPVRTWSQAAPFVHTHPASRIALDGAALNGMVVPNSPGTIAWFEWGTNTAYGQTVQVPDSYTGTAVLRLTANTGQLLPGLAYHFRLGASNASGVVYGIDRVFRAEASGKVAAWGSNSQGESTVPAGLSNIVALTGAYEQSLALRADGTVVRWGYVPPGTEGFEAAASNVVALTGSAVHVLALRSDGTLLALGTSGATNVPAGLSNVVAIAAGGLDGSWFSLAVKADGTVAGWGSGFSAPPKVPSWLTNVTAVAAGSYHAAALRTDGRVVCWGSNGYGQTNTPAGLSNVVQVACGLLHTVALKADGTVSGWGDFSPPPAGLKNVTAIAAGNAHDVALGPDRKITWWGTINAYGTTPAPGGLSNAVLIASGNSHILALAHNVAPSVVGNISWTYPNTDRYVQIWPPFDANNDPVQLYIRYPPSTGQLFQYDSGLRGTLISTSGTPVTDPLWRVIYAPPSNSVSDIYGAFGYAATDGELDSAAAWATMQIFLPAAPQLSAALSRFEPTGGFELNFTGTVGATYSVWSSTNLANWELLGPASGTSNGWFRLMDSDATNWAHRFYRASAP